MDEGVRPHQLVVGDRARRGAHAPHERDGVGGVAGPRLELVAEAESLGQRRHGGTGQLTAGFGRQGQAEVGPVSERLGGQDVVAQWHGNLLDRHGRLGRARRPMHRCGPTHP